MICEFNDGLKVNYSGSLQITKGKEVNVLIKKGFIPGTYLSELDSAVSHHSCSEMRSVANDVVASFGKRACIH